MRKFIWVIAESKSTTKENEELKEPIIHVEVLELIKKSGVFDTILFTPWANFLFKKLKANFGCKMIQTVTMEKTS